MTDAWSDVQVVNPGTVAVDDLPGRREAGWPAGVTTSPPTAAVSTEVDLLAGLRTGTWLDAQQFPPLRYAVPGLIPEGFTLLIGPPKAGKSWLALGAQLSVAAGGRALGQLAVGAARRVLYLALEDGDRRMQDRCRQLLGDEPIPALFCYLTVIPAGRVLDVIRQFLERHPDTALVVIDTLGRVMPPAQVGESAYQRDYRVGAAIKREADQRPGLAVVVLHHDRKATSDDFVDSVSGTHGLAGAADTIIVLARKRQSTDGLLKVTGRDVPEAEYALRMSDGAWVLDGATLDEAAEHARQREETDTLSQTTTSVLDFVRDQARQHPDGVPAKIVAEKFGKDSYQYLRRQLEAGRLAQPRRGHYLPMSELSVVRGHTQLTTDSSDAVPGPGLGAGGARTCLGCRFPLDDVLSAAGATHHPNCQPTPSAGGPTDAHHS